MRLLINGYRIDLYAGTRIKQTKQVNDIGDLDTRQTNFTNKLTVPGTPNNVRAFNFLGIPGNQSNIPYQKNDAFLWGENEELLVYKGWAIVKQTAGHDYDIYVYDGMIDFYKAIENKTLTDMGISDLNHLKNLTNVVGTWTDPDLPYRYNVADYNGKMVYDLVKLNIDYLIPSASVEYLWEKLFEYIGWTFEGDVFATDDFLDLWLSYPKSIGDDTQATLDVHLWQFDGAPSYYANSFFGMYLYSNVLTHNPVVNNAYFESSQQSPEQPPDGQIITVLQDGLYKFTFSGSLAIEAQPEADPLDILLQTLENGEIIYYTAVEGIESGDDITKVFYINLSAGQSFKLYPSHSGTTFGVLGNVRVVGDMSIDADIVTGNQVDFEEAFIGMSIRDFVTDVMVRFSLTAYPDTINKHIKFLKHAEMVNNNPEDWSKKFVKRTSEDYIYGSYGQKNRFAYKYNEREAEHNDGFLYVGNVNLPAEKKVYQSPLYSPEKNKVDLVGQKVNVYKFWDKEVKDDGSLKYKELDGRFYIMKSRSVSAGITVGSEQFQEDQAVTSFPVEDFTGLAYKEVINNFYPTIYSVLNKSKVMDMVMNLTAVDVEKVDFSRPKFIEQEGAYFILNKIRDFEEGRLTKCEMIRMERSETETNVLLPQPNKAITINSSTLFPDGISRTNFGIRSIFSFINYVPQDGVTITATLYTSEFNGTPKGPQVVFNVDEGSGEHIYELPSPITDSECGYWVMLINDPNENLSDVSGAAVPCPADDPNIRLSFVPDYNDTTTGSPTYRDITYIFENFTPTTGTFKCQNVNFITNVPQGSETVINLTQLSEGSHVLVDVELNQGIGWYRFQILTDVINYDKTFFIN
ncbi:hypothetical protein [Aegicerativicinus sediminis]|uniref:hypothetical protein n=1 Tax=Aegicerativicinus sediminis TaxID=2893202 RepID=UPI001E3F1768|nr:hypothetical protein [Aegicerativicinus sediminis]